MICTQHMTNCTIPLNKYESLPNREIITRMNKHSPKCYNGYYPNNLLKPEEEIIEHCEKVSVEISSCLWQLDKKQDYTWQGCDMDGNAIAILFDGHGSNYCLNIIKNLSEENKIKLFEKDNNPIEILEKITDISSYNSKDSGGCIVMCKITNDKVHLWSVGDSKGVIYKNNVVVSQTIEHNADYPGEIERLTKLKNCSKNQLTIKARSLLLANHGLRPSFPFYKNKVTHKEVLRFKFEPYNFHNYAENDYAMSRSVGHCGLSSPLGENIEYKCISFDNKDEVYVVLASDGLWDVQEANLELLNYIKKGAYNTCLVACNKWYEDKIWVHDWDHNCERCKKRRNTYKINNFIEDYKNDESVTTDVFGIGSDDIGIIVMKKPEIKIEDEDVLFKLQKEVFQSVRENLRKIKINKLKVNKLKNCLIKTKIKNNFKNYKIKFCWSKLNKKMLNSRKDEWKYCDNDHCSEIILVNKDLCEMCELEDELYN